MARVAVSRRTCVDAPLDASGILGTVGHVIRCGRVSGLEDAACLRRGPVWRYAGRDQFAYPRSMALRPECWFARPGLLTVCPYVPSPPLTSGDNPTAPAYAAAIAGSL